MDSCLGGLDLKRSCCKFRFFSSVLIFGALVAAAPAQKVTVSSLLDEMTSLDWLSSRPKPYFTAAQASSYDRASVTPADDKNWFANGDLGKYLRVEEKGGRKEYVMADLKGPGTVVRVWSANPMGTIRFYFDGETEPRIQEKMVDFLTGKVKPFGDPISYMAAQGTNIYFPFPYAKSLKVTVENDKPEWPSLYYMVGFRTYESGTQVETYRHDSLPSAKIEDVKRQLVSAPKMGAVKTESLKATITPRKSFSKSLTARAGGVLKMLQVKIPFPLVLNVRAMDWDDAYQPHNVLRQSTIRISCDGERTVDVPLGDFFATAPGPSDSQSFPITVTPDGTMTCYWPMPFFKKMDISIIGPGKIDVPVTVNLAWAEKKFEPETYYFRSVYNSDYGHTRPMRDMHFLNAQGEGLFVGTHLHVTNPTPAWWGEGDEKVYVDGETFPSTFGTGTEDYFGYAWCSPQLFTKPFHGQSRCDGPGNFGQTSVRRFQTFDPITFTKSLKFDIEMWHWAEVNARFARVSYWYSRPGSKANSSALKANDRLLVETLPPAPVKGALEAETLKYVSSGGTTELQGGFWELSSGRQLWWQDPKPGEKLTVTFEVKDSGSQELFGSFCHARDYGIHSLRVLDSQGKEVISAKEMDFFGDGVKWNRLSIGRANFTAGTYTLEVVSKGHRTGAVPRNMFGLDYLILERK